MAIAWMEWTVISREKFMGLTIRGLVTCIATLLILAGPSAELSASANDSRMRRLMRRLVMRRCAPTACVNGTAENQSYSGSIQMRSFSKALANTKQSMVNLPSKSDWQISVQRLADHINDFKAALQASPQDQSKLRLELYQENGEWLKQERFLKELVDSAWLSPDEQKAIANTLQRMREKRESQGIPNFTDLIEVYNIVDSRRNDWSIMFSEFDRLHDANFTSEDRDRARERLEEYLLKLRETHAGSELLKQYQR